MYENNNRQRSWLMRQTTEASCSTLTRPESRMPSSVSGQVETTSDNTCFETAAQRPAWRRCRSGSNRTSGSTAPRSSATWSGTVYTCSRM